MADKKEPPSERTLYRDVPELKNYLKKDAQVLDVGCGEGTITLGVAAFVDNGKVFGTDPLEERIEEATKWAAHEGERENVSFEVCDVHNLPYSDDTFDVVYSHTAMHFFLNPIQALLEQKRVTKTGGWVIASGVRDHNVSFRYPACPNWEKVGLAFEPYSNSVLQQFRVSQESPTEYRNRQIDRNPHYGFYYDTQAGRKCPGWFREAGFEELKIEVKTHGMKYFGADAMTPNAMDLVVLGEPETEGQKLIAMDLEKMIAEGFLDEETLLRAKEEIRVWHEDPHAFHFRTFTFVAGRVLRSEKK